MGRLVRAHDVTGRPDPLGRRGQARIAALLEARGRARGLDPEERRRVLDLACRIADLIVGERIEREPAILERCHGRALAGLAPLPPLSIRVHPEDRAAAGIDALARSRGCEVIDDPGVGRGGCVVAWERTELDASLAALRASLLEPARGGPA
jgi:flagellar assembly protein FliH